MVRFDDIGYEVPGFVFLELGADESDVLRRALEAEGRAMQGEEAFAAGYEVEELSAADTTVIITAPQASPARERSA